MTALSRIRLVVVALAMQAVACGSEAPDGGPAPGDGGLPLDASTDRLDTSTARPEADTSTDRPEADSGAAVADVLPPDAPAACACAAEHFCSLPSRTCVSAVIGVAAGNFHTCAVHKDGTVSCWGAGAFIAPGLPDVTPPIRIPLPAAASAVAVGIEAACALLAGGEVRCWGKLGPTLSAPAAVVKEDGKPLVGATRVAGGSLAFCASHPDGTYCWGDNQLGELARPVAMTFPPTTAVLAQAGPRPLVAATVAILVHDGGSRLCGWGTNDSGLVPGGPDLVEQPACVDGVPDVLELAAGDGHVCVRHSGNAFSCWGQNSGGQLGVGDEAVEQVPIPGARRTLPAPMVTLVSGAYHACALLATGALMCWGSNEHGECGLPPSAPLFAPTAVAAPPMVALGAGAGAQHTCGILADGSVVCWGFDDDGQLGRGVTTVNEDRYAATPEAVRW